MKNLYNTLTRVLITLILIGMIFTKQSEYLLLKTGIYFLGVLVMNTLKDK